MDEGQLAWNCACKGLDQRPGKQLECHHRGNGVAGQSKEVLLLRWSVWRGRPRQRKRHAPEHNGLSWLDQGSGEEKLRFQFGEDILD